jgi:hypothetical protein
MPTVGGIVIVDDYRFFSTGATTAVDEFIASATGYLPKTRSPAPYVILIKMGH